MCVYVHVGLYVFDSVRECVCMYAFMCFVTGGVNSEALLHLDLNKGGWNEVITAVDLYDTLCYLHDCVLHSCS